MAALAIGEVRAGEAAHPDHRRAEVRAAKARAREVEVAQVELAEVRAAQVGRRAAALAPAIPVLGPLHGRQQPREVLALAARALAKLEAQERALARDAGLPEQVELQGQVAERSSEGTRPLRPAERQPVQRTVEQPHLPGQHLELGLFLGELAGRDAAQAREPRRRAPLREGLPEVRRRLAEHREHAVEHVVAPPTAQLRAHDLRDPLVERRRNPVALLRHAFLLRSTDPARRAQPHVHRQASAAARAAGRCMPLSGPAVLSTPSLTPRRQSRRPRTEHRLPRNASGRSAPCPLPSCGARGSGACPWSLARGTALARRA